MPHGGRAIAVLTSVALLTGALAAPASAATQSRERTRAVAAPAAAGPVEPGGTPADVVTGLAVPWSILQLHDSAGTVLVSERRTGVIERLTATGLDPLATVPGVADRGEGGLLGLATLVDGGTRWIYAYLTTATDNRVVRMVYTDPGDPADATLGPPQVILSGLRANTNHDGGRIAFGPDGMLYVTVGDAGDTTLPQKLSSLNGKILRMTPTGAVPPDNPFPGSRIYSYGHRNPQGLAWDAEGQLWESELGQSTWDEFNRIVPGGNYGWPVVEGRSTSTKYINPWLQWPTAQASPSGLAYIDGTFFMASLRGQRLWSIYVDKAAGTARAVASYVNTYGRLRDVTSGPGGTLWMLTNNTARGTVRPGDDRILQVNLVPTATVTGGIDCATCPIAGRVAIDVGLERLVSGAWSTVQKTRIRGGAEGARTFTFRGLQAGTYRVSATDAGGGGYRSTVGPQFVLATSATRDVGTVRLTGVQLDRDLTGDGLNDLLATTPAGALVVYDGKAGGGFAAQRTIEADWSAATATAQAGDFDGDGAADVVTRAADGTLTLHRGDGAGGWAGTAPLGSGPADGTLLLAPGDWNGDGRPDLITGDPAGRLWLWSGNGTDPLTAPVQIGKGWTSPIVMAVGDLSRDGRPDLVGRNAKGELILYPGNGTGGFGSWIRMSPRWRGFTAIFAAGDVTADARPDILTRLPAGTLRIYKGTTSAITQGATLAGDWSGVTFSG